MDFDDLDEALEQRVAAGEITEGMAAMLEASVSKRKRLAVYKPKAFMPPIKHSFRIPAVEDLGEKELKGLPKEPSRKVSMRAILFYGANGSVSACARMMRSAPPWIQIAVHEWPTHGSRGEDTPPASFNELVEDAFKGVRRVIDEHAENGELEGAPYALMGYGVGAELMVAVAEKVRQEIQCEPAAVVVLDRGAPHIKQWTDVAKELMKQDPRQFTADYWGTEGNIQDFAQSYGEENLERFNKDHWLAMNSEAAPEPHSFDCDILVVRAAKEEAVDQIAHDTRMFHECKVKLEGTSQELLLPVRSKTTVNEVQSAIAEVVGVPASDVSLGVPDGASGFKQLSSADKLGDAVTVKGPKSLRARPHVWPHPVVIIGCGYNGIKTGMEYMKSGNPNFQIFDRNDKPGGYCWISAANKQSKIQTEFASFNIWWGPDTMTPYPEGGANGSGKYYTWFNKAELLDHFMDAVKQYGLLPNISFKTNVSKLDILPNQESRDRYYELTIESLSGAPTVTSRFSVMYNYPGCMMRNRIVNYPGEDVFDGHIGYGMNDDFPYHDIKGKQVAILGNGAFAVENVRSCVEGWAQKVYIITRRKNLPSPRVPCWFVHQGPLPTPGRLVIEMFEPMYQVGKMGDPWSYHAVHASKDRMKVSVIQASRFGIGDITFIANAYGKLEYVEDTLKHVTKHTLHLSSGRKLTDVEGICKSLGLLGDWKVDQMHKMKAVYGSWCQGDFRRVMTIDPTGMNAANFTTFSLGIGAWSGCKTNKFMHDFPEEYYVGEKNGLLDMLPKNFANQEEDKPCYVTDVKFAMFGGMMVGAFIPKSDCVATQQEPYKHALYHKLHPVDHFLKECIADWDKYQKLFKEQGCTQEYIPYPYNKELIDSYFSDYSKAVGCKTVSSGPTSDDTAKILAEHQERYENGVLGIGSSYMSEKLHKDLNIDVTGLMTKRQAHKQRAKLTGAPGDSALDYSKEHYEEWKQYTSAECKVQNVDALHKDLLNDEKAMEVVYEFLSAKKAPNPTS